MLKTGARATTSTRRERPTDGRHVCTVTRANCTAGAPVIHGRKYSYSEVLLGVLPTAYDLPTTLSLLQLRFNSCVRVLSRRPLRERPHCALPSTRTGCVTVTVMYYCFGGGIGHRTHGTQTTDDLISLASLRFHVHAAWLLPRAPFVPLVCLPYGRAFLEYMFTLAVASADVHHPAADPREQPRLSYGVRRSADAPRASAATRGSVLGLSTPTSRTSRACALPPPPSPACPPRCPALGPPGPRALPPRTGSGRRACGPALLPPCSRTSVCTLFLPPAYPRWRSTSALTCSIFSHVSHRFRSLGL